MLLTDCSAHRAVTRHAHRQTPRVTRSRSSHQAYRGTAMAALTRRHDSDRHRLYKDDARSQPARGRCPQPITGPLPTTVRGGCACRNGRIHSWKLPFRPPDHQSRWPSAHAPSARALLSVSAVRGEHAVLGEHAGHDTPQLSLSLRLYPHARAIRRSAQLSTLTCP